MKLPGNPLSNGVDFGPVDLVGRRDEVTYVERAIRDGTRLFVIGPRDFGETMILRAAEQNMTLKGTVVLYLNAETTLA